MTDTSTKICNDDDNLLPRRRLETRQLTHTAAGVIPIAPRVYLLLQDSCDIHIMMDTF